MIYKIKNPKFSKYILKKHTYTNIYFPLVKQHFNKHKSSTLHQYFLVVKNKQNAIKNDF